MRKLSGLNIKVPRLGVNRLGTYYVRFSSVDPEGKRLVHQLSLRTKNSQVAKILALKFCLNLVSEDMLSDLRKSLDHYEFDLSTGTAKSDGPEDHARMLEAMRLAAQLRTFHEQLQPGVESGQSSLTGNLGVGTDQSALESELLVAMSQLAGQALAQVPKPTDVGVKLREAFDGHLVEEGRRLKAQETVKEKAALFNEFCMHFGDIYLNQITKVDISERWRTAEFNRPNQKKEGATLSLARLEKRRGYLKKFFEWAKARGSYIHENPMAQAMGTKKEIRAKQQSWAEFTLDDLKLLFSEQYKLRMTELDWYWAPLISLFSGARLSEIANLTTSDLLVVEGVHCMHIADAKTVSGVRVVPIHSALLKLGFWDYVEELRAQGFERIYPNRPADKPEKMSGRMWGVWVNECGITDQRKVFHSFRSTAITDLHNAEASHAGIHRAVGHATAGTKGAHGTYVRGIDLKVLKFTIEALRYDTVDIALLRLEDPSFKDVLTKLKRKLTDPVELAKAERRKRHLAAKADRELRLAQQRKAK